MADLASAGVLLKAARAMWRPPPDLTISQWADQHRYLSAESSSEPGRWRTERTPYLREPMDAVTDAAVREVVMMVGSQVGKTEVCNNIAGYYISQDPAPILVIQPTLTMAKTWSEDRFAPMLRDSPIFAGLVKDPRSRDSGNTVFHKVFPGGHATVTGANSAAGLASRPIRVLLFDEVDRYPPSAGTEGDPVTLARKRTATFWNRKVVMVSSPTRKGASRIEQGYERSDKRHYLVPCTHCGHEQVLRWSHVRWSEGDPETAHLVCQDCGVVLTEQDRHRMILSGRWEATAPFRGIAGFWMSGLYSPWQRLADMVTEFLAAKDYPDTLMAWQNTTLAELWEERGQGAESHELAEMAGEYEQGTVPAGGLVLAAGVDVQRDRLAVQVVAFGERETMHVVLWDEIMGGPNEPATWASLDEILDATYAHESGAALKIELAAIDEGDGVTTGYVRDYVSRQRRAINIKGASHAQKALLIRPTKRGNPWMVDVSTIKGMLLPRLKTKGTIHFPAEMTAEYYEQLTSESLVKKYVRGFPKYEWVKDRKKRNEALDTLVYAYVAALHRGLKRRDWAKLRARIEGAAVPVGAQDTPAPAPPPVQRKIQMPKRGSFSVGNWR